VTEIIQKRKVEWITMYFHSFKNMAEPDRGYSFGCDKDGKLLVPEHQVQMDAIAKDPTHMYIGIQHWDQKVVHPTVIKCDGCGQEIALCDPMTNECECGRFYNGGGQALTHPRHWGEETNESFDDHGNYMGEGWAPRGDE